jgi:hypothetical protein
VGVQVTSGAGYSLRRAIAALLSPFGPRPAPEHLHLDTGRWSITRPPRHARVGVALGPATAILQRIDPRFLSIERIEVGVPRRRIGSSARIEISLRDETGRVLAGAAVDATWRRSAPNGALALDAPVDCSASGALFLVVRVVSSANDTPCELALNGFAPPAIGGTPSHRQADLVAVIRSLANSRLPTDFASLDGGVPCTIIGRIDPAYRSYSHFAPWNEETRAARESSTRIVALPARALQTEQGAVAPWTDAGRFRLDTPPHVPTPAQIRGAALLTVPSGAWRTRVKAAIAAAEAFHAPVAYVAPSRASGDRAALAVSTDPAFHASRYVIDASLCAYERETGPNATLRSLSEEPSWHGAQTRSLQGAVEAILAAHGRHVRPRLSLIVELQGDESVEPLLACCAKQTFAGPIEVVLVSRSPQQDPIAQAVFERTARDPIMQRIAFKVVRGEPADRSTCLRNVALAQASGDFVLFATSRSLFPRDFLQRHVDAHYVGDCEVVIGPRVPVAANTSVDAALEPPASARTAAFEGDHPERFVNLAVANVSIRRAALGIAPFDPAFPSRMASGELDWQFFELAYRLYRDGHRVRFASNAVAWYRDERLPQPAQATLAAMRAVLEKHEELARVAADWFAARLHETTVAADSPEHDAHGQQVLARLAPPSAGPAVRAPARRLRILAYRWHTPFQYELHKLPHDFTLVTGLGTRYCDHWDFAERPIAANVRMVPIERADPRDFDVAIAQFDEFVLSPKNTLGALPADWGTAFKWFRENVSLPTIAVCHGMPQFHGQFDPKYAKPDLLQPIEDERRKLVELLADTPVVTTSHQAEREWGFRRARTIWPASDPCEFPPGTFDRGVLTSLAAGTPRAHDRGRAMQDKVLAGSTGLALETLFVPDPSPSLRGNEFAVARYRNYVDALRRHCAYFNPVQRIPMARSRIEAMLCGMPTVSAASDDVSMFIENGVNGFYSNEPDELRDQLLFIVRNPDRGREIGMRARTTALHEFHPERFVAQWQSVLAEVIG